MTQHNFYALYRFGILSCLALIFLVVVLYDGSYGLGQQPEAKVREERGGLVQRVTDLSKELKALRAECTELKIQLTSLSDDVSTMKQQLQTLTGRTLKVDSFQVIFHDQTMTADQAKQPANPGVWTPYQLPGNGNSYIHPTRFGKRVVGTWWTPIRGLYDFARWGIINIVPNGNQVQIIGSAIPNAGRIEARIFVLYED